MRVLIGCEFTGIGRQAFRDQGHEAWSCDLLPAEDGSPYHIQSDVREVLAEAWDLAIFHPPCQYLTNAGARWWAGRQAEQREALAFVRELLAAPIPRIALENPPGRICTQIRRYDQIIHPWEYGENEEKVTALWLKHLPYLQATCLAWPRTQKVWRMGASTRRSQERSRTYAGIARAMSLQWGPTLERQSA